MKINERAARALARAWGVTWPITFSVEPLEGFNGTCRTSFARRRHYIKLSPNPTLDPEEVIRHELGHAVDAERRAYYEFAGDLVKASWSISDEVALMPYAYQRGEHFARSFERRDLDVRLCDESHTSFLDKLLRRR